jgi:hypothetical protein
MGREISPYTSGVVESQKKKYLDRLSITDLGRNFNPGHSDYKAGIASFGEMPIASLFLLFLPIVG